MKNSSYTDAFITCYWTAVLAISFAVSVAGGTWAFLGPIGVILGTLVVAIPVTLCITLCFPVTFPVLALAAWWLGRKSAHSPA
ncbi:MAG: hypothetical protein AUK53_11730 [Betaproteobacteria bacterium CG2_30_59_46]|nr:MAG: hypothetical protein AUK53_11730 [Betaproteobacteria bacterium CG2_30_59_46]